MFGIERRRFKQTCVAVIAQAFGVLAAAPATALVCPPVAPAGMMVERTSFGGVIAPNQAAIRSGVAAGVQAAAAAKRYLGLPPPTFVIAEGVAESARGGCDFLFPWRFSQFKAGEEPSTDVFAHEVGHALFIRYLVADTRGGQYGGDAPDWLDEMAGIAFESGDGVRMRRAHARYFAENSALIPLSRLLLMTHPEFSPQTTTALSSGEVIKRPPVSSDTFPYYATVRALFDFLIQRTGDEKVISRLAKQVNKHRPFDKWLLAASGGRRLKNLAELDAELQTFILADPSYAPPAIRASSKSP